MTTPAAGVTHDLVLHFNDSQLVGLVVRPTSYRVGTPPKFAPQLSVGNQSVLDLSWLRSFLFTFERGVGVRTAVHDPARSQELALAQNAVIDPDGVLMASVMPVQHSTANVTPLGISSGDPTFFFVMSDVPRLLVQRIGLITHTDKKWVISHTNQNGVDLTVQPMAAVMHSGIAVLSALNAAGVGGGQQSLIAYGNTGANPAARPYVPVFSNTTGNAYNTTQVNQLYNYDSRLWKTLNNQIAYYDATLKKWTSWQNVGEATTSILNTETFIGRKFFGKDDGLWAFDAGRIYQIEDYTAESSPFNFALMRVYRDAMYYNIGRKLLRYTAGGAIEEIPWSGGRIKGGQPGLGVLVIWAADDVQGGDVLWGLNPETGAVFPFFNQALHAVYVLTEDTDNAFSFLGAMPNNLVVGPINMSQYGPYTSIKAPAPIASFGTDQRIWSPLQTNPYMTVPATIALPTVDFGIPALVKDIVRIKVRYQMAAGDSIRIYRGAPSKRYPQGTVKPTYFGSPTINYLSSGNPFGLNTHDITQPLIFAAKDPYDSITFGVTEQPADFGIFNSRGTWQYETAPGIWASLNVTSRYDKPLRGQVTQIITFDVPADWIATSSYAPTAFHIRLYPGQPFAWSQNIQVGQLRLARRLIVADNYVSLGTITDSSVELSSVELNPPIPVRNLSLFLQLYGTTPVRPRLFGVEIEYTVPEADKLQIAAVVIGTNDIKILDGSVENSAAWIAQTLVSMWMGGVPRPVQLPFPFPTGHTRNMVLSVQPPGITVPVLSYGHSFLGAEYSILLKEV